MQYPEFVARFPDETEIGRVANDDELAIYRDNGHEIGVWRVNQQTGEGTGAILGVAESVAKRRYFAGTPVGRGR